MNTNNIDKYYYSISEVAEMFEVAPSLLRFWETEFRSIQPKKNNKGNRKYTKENIQEIKLIYHLLKEKGYTISGAKDYLKNNRKKAESTLEAVERLLKVRNFLEDLKNQI